MAEVARASGGAPSGAAAPDNSEIIRTFQAMMSQKEALSTKISELTVEHAEYKRVAETLKPMDASRRCFQLLNGTLVEKTIGEVAPDVGANRDSLEQVVKGMHERLNKLVADMKDYQQKFNRALQGLRARARRSRAPAPDTHRAARTRRPTLLTHSPRPQAG
jgi:prefoldin subunit 5